MKPSTGTTDSIWSIPLADAPVRQGDAIASQDPKTGTITRIALVITADCDIANRKHGADLACLAVTKLEDYARTIWAEKKLNKVFIDEIQKVRTHLARWHELLIGNPSHLSLDSTEAWIRRESAESICKTLNVPLPESKKLEFSLNRLRRALSSLDSSRHLDELEQYAAFRGALADQPPLALKAEALKRLQSESLPSDVFLLPQIPQVECDGAVVLLRELIGVASKSIHTRVTDLSTSSDYLRLGRLQDIYKYSISQAFGSLYSRIGLPDAFADQCRLSLAELAKTDSQEC